MLVLVGALFEFRNDVQSSHCEKGLGRRGLTTGTQRLTQVPEFRFVQSWIVGIVVVY